MSLKEHYDNEIERMRREDPEYQAIELMLAVSERMRQLMDESGLTQAELARRMGVTRQYVSKLLRDDECNLTLRQIARIALALGAEVAWDFRHLAGVPVSMPTASRWLCPTDASTISLPLQEPPTNALALAA